MNKNPIRVLHDAAFDGPANMARDEALLSRVGRADSPPTLRLYQWDPPTISLGYFQRYGDYTALPSPAGALPVVRRLTGGGAILHDWELTYSLALPIAHPLLEHGPSRLYQTAHDAVIACLAQLGLRAVRCGTSDDSGAAKGPFFCFARRHCYDVLVAQDKIAGSAQRRTRQAVLQHGSIVVGNRFPQQPTATATEWIKDRRSEPAELASDAALISRYTTPGHTRDDANIPSAATAPHASLLADLRERFTAEFCRVASVALEEADWLHGELDEVQRLIEKYSSPSWTQRI